MVNKSTFCKRYAKRYGTTIKDATALCESVFETLSYLLYEENEDVFIGGLGSFKQKHVGAKPVRHPITRQMTIVPARTVIKFNQLEKTKNI